MHFPELWEKDSLIFDDRSERELLIRQFEELIGEISADEGYNLELTTESFPFLRNENGKVNDTADAKHVLEMPTMFRTPTKQRHHTKRLDLNEGLSPLETHPSLGSPLKTEDPATGMLSVGNPSNRDAVDIAKSDLPGSNYHTAISDTLEGSQNNGYITGTMTSMGPTKRLNYESRSGATISLDYRSAFESETSCHSGGLTPRRLFPPDKGCSKIKATLSPRKRTRTYPYQPNPPRASPRPRNEESREIPQDIMKDLAVIRTHRRSSYADGDSLVEVQPSSLPGSPTMFAYRDPEGRLRVPLDMHCNQKALATYRGMTPSTSVTHRIISIRQQDMVPSLPTPSEAAEDTLSTSFGSQGIPRGTGNKVKRIVSQGLTPNQETDSGMMRDDASSAQTLIKEWEELRQLIGKTCQ